MIRDSAGQLRLELPRPSVSPLFAAAHRDPGAIDALLPHLLDPTLPVALAFMLKGPTSQSVTPPHLWGGDPTVPRNVYITCHVHATLLGRAFALLSSPTPTPEDSSSSPTTVLARAALLPVSLKKRIYSHHECCAMQLCRFWALGLAPVLAKGILSGPDPRAAARFAAAVLVLSCWRAVVAARPPVTSTCGAYVWYSGVFEDGPAWGAVELADALDKTAALPRENWNVGSLIAQRGQGAGGEYVPVECYRMLAAARVHVASGRGPRRHNYRNRNEYQSETTRGDHIRGDYTSAELNSLAREVMEEAEQTVHNHASRINWDDYLGLAFNEWKKEADKQWAPPKTEKRGPSGNKERERSVGEGDGPFLHLDENSGTRTVQKETTNLSGRAPR